MPPERIIQIRTSLALSQERMAGLLGVSFATVNRWEKGTTSPIGLALELYVALELCLGQGLDAASVLGVGLAPGPRLKRIFNLAYSDVVAPC